LSNFKIIDIKFNECNGGSFRIYFAKKNSTAFVETTELISKILEDEAMYGIKNAQLYKDFINNCDKEVLKLNKFIDTVNLCDQKMYIYGASTKGNCLLQYANIGENKIKYAVERNLSKVGKMTSTGIGIISEETMRSKPPEYLLVLPWHFRDEIIKREDDYLEKGGMLVFPFPHFEIYSKKQKVLVTGCNGMIAKYVLDEYKEKHNLFGFAHENRTSNSKLTRFYFDIRNVDELKVNLNIIKPDIIVHLSGVSSSIEAFKNPISTLELNGLTVAHICEIIYKNQWPTKLFNASSSEIYKGHITYEVKEDDHSMFHCHPYSIAKIMGHTMVEFYRDTYKLPFSNGTLFTVESKHKIGNFLLRKIADHSKIWKQTFEPITLGSLDSYRTILHASDAAKAIKLILDQPVGDTYVVCGNEHTKILDLVLQLYSICGINIVVKDNVLYSDTDNKIVAIIENVNNGIDTVPIDIRGTASKLHGLGWSPKFSVDDILKEIIC
jgi:GDP-D-mannose dehydratase